jgi:hypothetical protein
MSSFEESFSVLEQAAANVVRAAKGLTACSATLKRAAAAGDLVAVGKSRERLTRQLDQLREEVGVAATSWPFKPHEEEEYLKTKYEAELEHAARTRGLSVQHVDGRLVIFPSVIRVVPKERVVRVDAKRLKTLRPSVLAEHLSKKQAAASAHAPDAFIELLRRAYLTLTGPGNDGQTKPLRQIYEMLTLLPSARSQYEQSDFVRDVYFLDRSQVRRTRDGRMLKLVPPSTAAKEGKGYTFYSRDGEQFDYYAVAFPESTHDGTASR